MQRACSRSETLVAALISAAQVPSSPLHPLHTCSKHLPISITGNIYMSPRLKKYKILNIMAPKFRMNASNRYPE
jgi:hypothetical protein